VKTTRSKKPILRKLNKQKKDDFYDKVDMKSLETKSSRSYPRGDESYRRRSGTEHYRISSNQHRSKRGATTCTCLDKGYHYNNLVMDTKFTGSVEKLYNLLFNCDFLELFLTNIEKCSDIKLGEWKPTQSNVLRRSSSYTMRLTHPIGPKSTKCFFEDECQHCDYDNYITNVTTTTTPDVPQGNCFVVKTRLCIMWAGANEVRVIVTCGIEWSKNAFFKTQIERGAVDGQRAYYKSLTKYIQNFIAMHPGEFQDDLGSPVPEMEQAAFEQSNIESVLAIENLRIGDNTQSSIMEETTFQHFFGSLSRSLPYELASYLQQGASLVVSVSQPANILSAKSLVFLAFFVLLVSHVQMLFQLRAINNQMSLGVSMPANQAALVELRKRWTFAMLDTWYERDDEALREYFVKKFGELTV
ncbi:10030_t:CDS:2, partial [Paraglomus occultum]